MSHSKIAFFAILERGILTVAPVTLSYRPVTADHLPCDTQSRTQPDGATMKTILALTLALLFSVPAAPQATELSPAAIRQVIEQQQAAWNRHDLEAFMSGYRNSADLTFFSGAHESKGWQAALERYQKNYEGPGHEMGKLEFTNLRIEMLGPDSAFVRGEFRLTMTDGKTPHGLFTLIFKKFPEGWKIIHDHSSGE